MKRFLYGAALAPALLLLGAGGAQAAECAKQVAASYAYYHATGMTCAGIAIGTGPAGPITGGACGLGAWFGGQFIDFSEACRKG